ncbi:MAG: NAD(+) diphosphatase [Pseudomonadota bacterium]
MTIDFDERFPEPSQFVGFGQNVLESASESRDETSLQTALDHPNQRFHLFADGKILVKKGESPTATFSQADISRFDVVLEKAIFLGTDGIAPRLAAPANISEDDLDEPYHLYDMRALLYSSSVADKEAGACASAASLLHWHETNRFCGRCGSETRSMIGGYRRDCPTCDHKIFPRTDPVVIMLTTDGDRCLLGRSPHFQPFWYSTLAGFIEPGETIEAAVRRETREESGIEVRRVRYHASQPWPFPHSLMIGTYGEAASDRINFDRNELEDCKWFTRDEVKLMIADEHPDKYRCPPTKAIAHTLIRDWVNAGANKQ